MTNVTLTNYHVQGKLETGGGAAGAELGVGWGGVGVGAQDSPHTLHFVAEFLHKVRCIVLGVALALILDLLLSVVSVA